MPLDWSRLFPPGDFRWHLGLRPGDARAFFAPTGEGEGLLAERAGWLAAEPGEYALLTEDGVPLLAEAAVLARSWGVPLADDSLHALGRAWEPDFVLLSLGEAGPVVEGGVVCFPSSWALREKLGRTLSFTHGPVPKLNEQLAPRIDTVLRKLSAGAAWERENWSLARTPERNRHPRREEPRLDGTIMPDEVWLRSEHQVLLRLPQTGGVLFGIRIELVPMRTVLAEPVAREGLRRALESMSDEAAVYKAVTTARPVILSWLR